MMLYIALGNVGNTQRRVTLRTYDPVTGVVTTTLSTLDIYNPSVPYNSQEQLLAYYPNYKDSNTAVTFINLEGVIPCLREHMVNPVCRLFTFEEDNLQKGEPFVQVFDAGSNFQIFTGSSGLQQVETFAFGVRNCSTFSQQCVLPTEVILVCWLPYNLCG